MPLRSCRFARPVAIAFLASLVSGAPARAQDRDNDGVPDGADSCVEVANPDQRDTDSDGFGNACDPDYDNNGAVGIPDFNTLRSQFGKSSDDPDFDPDVDHNGDEAVGIPDFNVLRSFFGLPPGPAGDPGPPPGAQEPPQITPRAFEKREPLRPFPQQLPPGARAQFPAYDGAPFYVTLPIAPGTPGVSFDELQRILGALGLSRGAELLTPPPPRGVSPPPADFDGLAQAVAFEYASIPEFERPRTQEMIDVFLGRKEPTKEIDAALETGEGMNFAQFVAGIERRRIFFPLMQRVGDVPVEHAGVIAAAWEGQEISSVYGAIYNTLSVDNTVNVPLEEAAEAGARALDELPDVVAARPPEPNDCGLDFRRVSVNGDNAFVAAVFDQLGDFEIVDRVVRGCGSGGALGGTDDCDRKGQGRLLNFAVIQGDLRDSRRDPDGRGVPGGARDVTIRISDHDPLLGGPSCGSTGLLGWLAPEGFDCLRDTRDDAGGQGVYGEFGDGLPGDDGNPGTSDDRAAPLLPCRTRLWDVLPDGTKLSEEFREQCVVDFDQDGDGEIDNAPEGNPSSGPTVGETPGNETTNARLACLVAPLGTPELVLLPSGDAPAGGVSLRYAWRMLLTGAYLGQVGEFLLWLDAETARILKLDPLIWDTNARGIVFNRDPGIGDISQNFEVDPAVGGVYTLQLNGMADRVDYLNNGFDADDVSISDSSGGSSATFANFDQAPINVAAQAVCASGTNKAFQQVNFFGVFHRLWRRTLNLGVFTPFPTSEWNPRVESASAGCNAYSSMNYGACQGYYNAACPDYSNGSDWDTCTVMSCPALDNMMNFAHDNPVVAHELAHNSTARFT